VVLDGVYRREAQPADRAFMMRWFETVEGLLAEGKIRTHPREILEGGLEVVVRGLKRIKEGRVSGRKLVVGLSRRCLG
jgi:hypothetical protein